MYEDVEYVIANYLTTRFGETEEKAVRQIRALLSRDRPLAERYPVQLAAALADQSYSWLDLLHEYEAATSRSEDEARSYAKAILWDEVLGHSPDLAPAPSAD